MLRLASIAFNTPWAIAEQIRLLEKFLCEPYELTVWDNSSEEEKAYEIENICDAAETGYIRVWPAKREHHHALNIAAHRMQAEGADYIGFLDHDIWPTSPIHIVPLVRYVGFFGVGQRHGPTGHRYLWPGLAFFSRNWLGTRQLNFDGIKAVSKRDDGDTGSAMWQLFDDSDWAKLEGFPLQCSYVRLLDDPNVINIQGWGYEKFGPWIHLTNASRWLETDNPDERERLMRETLAQL